MSKKIPRGEDHLICPFHKLAMSEVCHKCPLWTQVRGKNPQSMEEIDDWGCAVAWLPILLIENAQQIRQHERTTQAFRNETAQANIAALHVALGMDRKPAMQIAQQEPTILIEHKE